MKTSVLFGAVLLSFSQALAFNPQPDPPGFGMFGIVPGETMRLNVANPDVASGKQIPPPCRVELSFVDGAGNLLVPAVQQPLRAGESAHIDVNADRLISVSALS